MSLALSVAGQTPLLSAKDFSKAHELIRNQSFSSGHGGHVVLIHQSDLERSHNPRSYRGEAPPTLHYMVQRPKSYALCWRRSWSFRDTDKNLPELCLAMRVNSKQRCLLLPS